jgi:hypothetical protein
LMLAPAMFIFPGMLYLIKIFFPSLNFTQMSELDLEMIFSCCLPL